jgi:hypothetical protein
MSVLQNGPDDSADAIRAAWFALEMSSRLTHDAVVTFGESHVQGHAKLQLAERVGALNAAIKALGEESKHRWGGGANLFDEAKAKRKPKSGSQGGQFPGSSLEPA